MRRSLAVLVGACLLLISGIARAAAKPHVILLTQSAGYDHDVVKPKEGRPSLVEQTFASLADRLGFTVQDTRDARTLTPEKIKSAQLIVFYTTGELPFTEDSFNAFDQWIKDGGSFLGIHAATDTFHKPPFHDKYNNIINGEFDGHPWTADTTVTLKVLDDKHPAMKGFPQSFTHKEEIYQFKNFDPDQVHVLLCLDMEKTALKKPRFIPIAWCKDYGKGKVFYTSLGHRADIWTSSVYQNHLAGAIQWLLGREKADVTPNPDVSRREERIAKEAAGVHSDLPEVPDGFTIHPFVTAPAIHSPASMCVTPDGKVFAAEDEYNTGGPMKPGTSCVKLCVDTNGDGKADRVTTFCDKLNSPQGMTYFGGTLYVVHAPYLTAFRDTNGDGVADTRENLITGLGPAPEGLVQHVPSGLRLGPDGYLYISIGDKGIVKATAKDGSTISLHGGGIIRLLPDGSHLQVFSWHTRNIYDVAISPELDIFTRDNTNDGDGWWSRLTQMQRDAEYGYPSLYEHFSDEMVPCLADYGSGSATGSLYVDEPGFPGNFGHTLYACDWARGYLYQHDLVRHGATFEVSQNQFCRCTAPTAIDVDAAGNLYLCDWGRHGWNASAPTGTIYMIRHKVPHPLPPIGDLTKASTNDLLALIVSPSQVRRREALVEIMHRGPETDLITALNGIAKKPGPIAGRIAALFALARIGGQDVQGMLEALASLPNLREYALRALSDRDDLARNLNPDLFVSCLKDPNPRVRVQAAIALGHLPPNRASEDALIPLTADTDVMVRQAAQQSLRRLNAIDACIVALTPRTYPNIVIGALRTLRRLHAARAVEAVSNFIDSRPPSAERQQAVKTLACLYKIEAPWDGVWWTPRPDTRGPYYKPVEWPETSIIGQRLARAIDDPDTETARTAIFECGLCQVPESIPALARMVVAGTALKAKAASALIDCKSDSADAISALEHIITTDSFDADTRKSAAESLGSIDAAQATVIALLDKLDSAKNLPDGLLAKLTDAVSAKPPTNQCVTPTFALLRATRKPTRIAAATSLVRSTDASTRKRIAKVLNSDDTDEAEAILMGIAQVPPDLGKPYQKTLSALLRDQRDSIRQAATIALAHLGDAAAVKELLALAESEANPVPIAAALSELAPDAAAKDQVLPIAQLLVSASLKASKSDDHTDYEKIVPAAQKFLADPRIPTTQATLLFAQLKQPGVISNYLRIDPIPAPATPHAFDVPFAPEQTPAGPFTPFSVNGKEMAWKPLSVKDPTGKQELEMPANSVEYLTATIDAPAATSAELSCGSDDGLVVWVNGKKVLSKEVGRSLHANQNSMLVSLDAGRNVLLFKVYNEGGAAGIQARVRMRPGEFEPAELTAFLPQLPDANPARGRKLFETVGCIQCHTTDRSQTPKGPFLGDAGAKFPESYLIESILRPSAQIAQGFQTEQVQTTGADGPTVYIGFPVKESNNELTLRDITGKVTVIKKSTITSRTTLSKSIMPEGLTNSMTLDDFNALIAYLRSLK